jgi:hypothetical protein
MKKGSYVILDEGNDLSVVEMRMSLKFLLDNGNDDNVALHIYIHSVLLMDEFHDYIPHISNFEDHDFRNGIQAVGEIDIVVDNVSRTLVVSVVYRSNNRSCYRYHLTVDEVQFDMFEDLGMDSHIVQSSERLVEILDEETSYICIRELDGL